VVFRSDIKGRAVQRRRRSKLFQLADEGRSRIPERKTVGSRRRHSRNTLLCPSQVLEDGIPQVTHPALDELPGVCENDTKGVERHGQHDRMEVPVVHQGLVAQRYQRIVTNRVELDLDAPPRERDHLAHSSVHLRRHSEGQRVLDRMGGAGLEKIGARERSPDALACVDLPRIRLGGADHGQRDRGVPRRCLERQT
jgi:hypothetical protein